MAIPTKLASLLLRTVAKPIAARIKERAQDAESFRTFCISMGRFVNRTSMQMQILASGHIPRKIKPLSEKKAINRGADFLGEAIIFTVGGAVIVAEVTRGSRAAEAKAREEEERKRREKADLEQRFRATELKLLALQDDLKRVERLARLTCEARTAGGGTEGAQLEEEGLRDTESSRPSAMQDWLWPIHRLLRA